MDSYASNSIGSAVGGLASGMQSKPQTQLESLKSRLEAIHKALLVCDDHVRRGGDSVFGFSSDDRESGGASLGDKQPRAISTSIQDYVADIERALASLNSSARRFT